MISPSKTTGSWQSHDESPSGNEEDWHKLNPAKSPSATSVLETNHDVIILARKIMELKSTARPSRSRRFFDGLMLLWRRLKHEASK
jgi:hypothetical protein